MQLSTPSAPAALVAAAKPSLLIHLALYYLESNADALIASASRDGDDDVLVRALALRTLLRSVEPHDLDALRDAVRFAKTHLPASPTSHANASNGGVK